MKSLRAVFGLPAVLPICWRRVWKRASSVVRVSSVKSTMSSPSALAGQKPTAPLAVKRRSATMRSKIGVASAHSSRAAWPTTSSSRMAG